MLVLLFALIAHAGWSERQATPLREENCFQDSDLAAFLAGKPQAAILVWSPEVAENGLAEFEAATADIPHLELLDPQSSDTDGKKLRALSLIKRGALVEYPALLVYRNGDWNIFHSVHNYKQSIVSSSPFSAPPAAVQVPAHLRKATRFPDAAYSLKPVWGTRKVASNFGLYDLDTGNIESAVWLTPGDARYGIFSGGVALNDGTILSQDTEAGDLVSMGALVNGEHRSLYRVLGADGRSRDYTIQHVPAAVVSKSRVVSVCTNQPPLTSAALSKDGTRIADSSGVVYELSPRNVGSCTVVARLGFPFGRAAFSFDGRKLAFTAGEGQLYVYEFATKRLAELTGLGDEGTPFYPEWREDNSLVVNWHHDGGGSEVVELDGAY